MNTNSKKGLILITFLALILSLLWTYRSIESKKDTKVLVPELFVKVKPDYKVVSKKDLKVWPAGTEFEEGLVAYFYAASPELFITPRIEFVGLNNGDIECGVQIRTNIRAIDDKSQVYWSYQLNTPSVEKFTLGEENIDARKKTEYSSKGLSIDVVTAYDLITEIREELQSHTGFLQLAVEIVLKINGSANGIQIEREIIQELPVSLQTNSFSIGKAADFASEIGLIQNINQNEKNINLLQIARENKAPVIVSLALLVVLTMLILSRKITKTKATLEHNRYKDWITEGNVQVQGKYRVNIINLQGLVDLAIDLDKRVIYDIKSRKYYVLTEDVVYIYDIEKSNALLANKQQFGTLLIDQELVTPEQLETGLYYQQKTGMKLGEALIALGFLSEATLYCTLAAQYNLNYYELNPTTFHKETKWLDLLTIPQARMLKVLPIGERADGKLVIATSEVSNKGVEKTLQEIFTANIELVVSRPSRISEILDRIEIRENEKRKGLQENWLSLRPYERLSKEELNQFSNAYHRGAIQQELLLKVAGFHNGTTTNIEFLNLLIGLDRAIKSMNWKERNENQIPQLLDLLFAANYLTTEKIDWIIKETQENKDLLTQFLSENYIVSNNTLKNANLILKTLENIL